MAQSVFKTKEEEYEKPKAVLQTDKDVSEYLEVAIKDCGDKEPWAGQPFLASIYEGMGTKGKNKGKPYFLSVFNIYDHETKEKLRVNVYLNGTEDNIKLKQGSAGYELVKSIDAVNGCPTKDNVIKISFEELQNYINSLNVVKCVVKENWNEDHSRSWMTLTITKIGE